MQLLVRGYMEVPLDISASRDIRKLIDSVIVILEGGDEGNHRLRSIGGVSMQL
jgi:hypothetical protein